LIQGLPGQVIPQACINGGGLWIRVIEDPPNEGETVASLGEPASYRAPKIMQPHVFHSRGFAYSVPRLYNIHQMMPWRFRAWQQIRIPRHPWHPLQQGNGRR